MVDVVKQSSSADSPASPESVALAAPESAASPDRAFEEFAASLFRMKRTMRAAGPFWGELPGGLKRVDATVLRIIDEHGECRPGFIADVLAVGPSVISRQLASLAEDGVVARRRDPEDGRAELVALTELGSRRLVEMRTAYVARMQQHFTHWDRTKVEAAARLLNDITDTVAFALRGEVGRHQTLSNEKEDA